MPTRLNKRHHGDRFSAASRRQIGACAGRYTVKMIDQRFGVRRYVAEYSENSEQLQARYEFANFDIDAFRSVFRLEASDPMFDCYQVEQTHLRFLETYLTKVPEWDFEGSSYYVEAHAI